MRGKWLLLSVSVVLVGVGAGAISLLRREAASKAPPARAPAPPPAADISLPAKIQAQHVVSVAPQIGGEIQEFLADRARRSTRENYWRGSPARDSKPSRKPRPAPATWRKPV